MSMVWPPTSAHAATQGVQTACDLHPPYITYETGNQRKLSVIARERGIRDKCAAQWQSCHQLGPESVDLIAVDQLYARTFVALFCEYIRTYFRFVYVNRQSTSATPPTAFPGSLLGLRMARSFVFVVFAPCTSDALATHILKPAIPSCQVSSSKIYLSVLLPLKFLICIKGPRCFPNKNIPLSSDIL